MEQFRKKRQSLKGSITRLKTFLNDNTSAAIGEYSVRLEKLEHFFKEYEALQDEIDAISPMTEEEEVYRSDVESMYYSIKAAYLLRIRGDHNERTVIETGLGSGFDLSVAVHTLVDNQTTMSRLMEQLTNSQISSPIQTNNAATQPQQQHDIRLPQIQLPEFDGTYTEWIRFKDLFETLIHTRTNLAGVEKFEYLQSKLKGDALSLIKHLKATNDNYSVAWDILKGKYENSEQIKRAYFELLFEQPAMKSPTIAEVKRIYNRTNEVINALKALNEPVDQWDSILIFHVEKKFDNETHAFWYRERKCNERPTFSLLLKFLEKRVFERENAPTNLYTMSKVTRSYNHDRCLGNTRKSFTYTASVHLCPVCKGNHFLFHCKEFNSLNIDTRYKVVRSNNLCFNCLQPGHRTPECTRSTCKHCNKRHNSLLHNSSTTSPNKNQSQINFIRTVCANSTNQYKQSVMLLPTAIILVTDSCGILQPCRALIDSGAQATLITESCVQRLHLRKTREHILMHGVGSNNSNYTNGKVQLQITSRNRNHYLSADAYCLSRLTQDLPAVEVHSNKFRYFDKLELADTHFDTPSKIDLILGVDLFTDIFLGDKHPTGNPTAFNTIFGWVIIGKIEGIADTKNRDMTVAHVCPDLSIQLQNFWNIEDVPDNINKWSPGEEDAEAHFVKTYHRTENGRYVVKLPFKQSIPELGDSKVTALKRFNSLERRLNQNSSLQAQYQKFMNEYIQLDHMELAEDSAAEKTFFMPHHAIFKPTSTTTKMRVVFDGSCKTTNGLSLNDQLLIGPPLQNNIFTLLLRFRKYQVGICSDIEKMYRQILIHPDDRSYQTIFWRDSNEAPLKTYQLKTVTYGTAAAPYLAIRTLHQVALDNAKQFSIASNSIKNDFYIDDYMTCTETIQEAIDLKNDVCHVLSQASFHLRKWASNAPQILDTIAVEDQEISSTLLIDDTQTVKTLGLYWDTTNDTFKYKVALTTIPAILTKRIILSEISKIFDPLGWLAPVVVSLKIFMQKLWLRQIEWDQPITDDLANQWFTLHTSINYITDLHVPRWINYQRGQHVELHGFSDASELAYSAAIYVKLKYNDSIVTHLLAAKTRVAPVKQSTLPRLELCAAQLMTKLMKGVQTALELENATIFGWSDSTIVLAWLSDHPRRWKTFIANRTSYILQVIPAEKWRHIQSQHNPADLGTRGLHPREIRNNDLWWRGPKMLHESLSTNIPVAAPDNYTDMEERKEICNYTTIADDEFIQRYSDYNKLLRLTGLILRFKNNCFSKRLMYDRHTDYLSAEELLTAHNRLIKIAQAQSYSKEIELLLSGRQLPKSNKFASLAPFMDELGLMRVGGRIENSVVNYDQKHPIILDKHHHLTVLIVRDFHQRYLHAGLRQLQYIIGTKYWIPGISYAIRRCVYKCIKCMRFRNKPYEQQMGNLPQHRVRPAATFSNVGVDFAGPISIKSWKGRGHKLYKCWIALFICLVTRAIHLDLVTELSTAALLATLRRFIARRGKPANIYSDNGTNLVGCNQYLQEVYQLLHKRVTQNVINHELTAQGIKWHFIPPHAPHFGGIWEAGVKSTKFHLRRVLSDTSATYEELYTTLCQVESCLNSRPLCLQFEGDVDPLTPAHFIIMRPMVSVPEEDFSNIQMNRVTRWQYLQGLVREFWGKWSKEYLNQLQQRPKWSQRLKNLNIDDIVIIKEDNLPPTKWSIGKVEQLHPGADNAVRVVTVKTSTGKLKRPISKLCPLFLDI